jgi:D-aspartate ligase
VGVLLLGADDYGTLAATRCYGRHGIAVAVADETRFAPSLASRYVSERLRHPPVGAPAALVDWLCRWGRQHPGTVLYPGNDHTTWLFASERERLGRVFEMFSPDEETIMSLLDKKRLYEACSEVGIEVPETRLLSARLGDGEAGDIADELGYPVILKPRTQAYLSGGIKGFIVDDPREFAKQRSRFHRLVQFNAAIRARYPDLAEPMVQRYYSSAETDTVSVAGFVGCKSEFVARAAGKILQRPRKVGIGLCFESRETEEPLLTALQALCRRVGYWGAFESEFVSEGGRRMMIDFNTRFYSQMAFEIARGLRIPLLIWHAARDEQAQLEAELRRSREWQPSGGEVYCHKAMLDLIFTLQRGSRRISRRDVREWRAWHARAELAKAATDAVRDPQDHLPARVDTLKWLVKFARHPRSFARTFVLNR